MKKPSQPAAVAIVVVAMVVAGVLGGVGLDNHLFWDDEATTAIYARNLIEQHKITAYNGKNLVGYSFGGGLGEDLGRELRVPPLPAVWAAVGMIAFGQDTFGGRIMFVIAGVVSLAVMAVWLRRHLGRTFAWYLPPVILALSPAYLLYVRNCRYYALAVMCTLLLWMFWAPGKTRRGSDSVNSDPLNWKCLLRYAGGAVALVALMSTYYLGAAVAFASLPLFFIHGRYRQPRQYVMLGVLLLTALGYGGWILATANPFAASYAGEQWSASGHFARSAWHLWMFVRDLGPHEFFPWLLAVPLLLPWFLPEFRRFRPLAVRGMALLGLALFYVTMAAAMTPPDMAKGDVAEMRYVVPMIAIGAAMAGVSIFILWQYWRPAAVVVFGLLIFSNVLHLGFFGKRLDAGRSWWPPTLYRYVYEITHDHPTGIESLVAVLDELPPGTTVRMWPEKVSYMVYPPMFYVSDLHYCDQLTEQKPIRADLLPLPGYLYRERSLPDVVVTPTPYVGETLRDLSRRHKGEVYHIQKACREHWNYTKKPEIPSRRFERTADDWLRYPGMVVLARESAPKAVHDALLGDFEQPESRHRLGLVMAKLNRFGQASAYFAAEIEADPDCVTRYLDLGDRAAILGLDNLAAAYYAAVIKSDDSRTGDFLNWANLLTHRGDPRLAIPYFRAVLTDDDKNAAAYVGLGTALWKSGSPRRAAKSYRKALEIDPNLPSAHAYLGRINAAAGKTKEAIAQYRKALELIEEDSALAQEIRKLLKRLQ